MALALLDSRDETFIVSAQVAIREAAVQRLQWRKDLAALTANAVGEMLAKATRRRK